MTRKSDVVIREVKKRETVQIHLPDNGNLEGPRGSQLETFLKVLTPPAPIVGAVVNGELRELTYPIEMDSRVRPVTMGSADGMRIYRRSLTFLLATAFEELHPDARLTVDHSVSSGGYYCEVSDHDPLTKGELQKVEDRMREFVDEDLPFAKTVTSVEEAIEHFTKKGNKDKVRLLTHRKKPHLVLYQLKSHRDYHHGYMVPSTGYLQWFALYKTGSGFTLRFPRRHQPNKLLPLPDYSKLLDTFREYGNWLNTLGISSIGALNDAILAGRAREVILVSEALHEGRIAEIAARITEEHRTTRLILVAGPSASGKTTFSKRLSVQLLVRGLSPFPLELDHYFVDREKTPVDKKGEFNYESLKALDLERLNHDLRKLIQGERVQLPDYNFITGQRELGEEVQLAPDQLIILEGIHGLNPELIPEIPSENTFRVYVSALTQLNLDSLNRVSTTDTRLIRRIVRDATRRGYSAAETIHRWESVRRGEKRYIFPFQENADVMFNSALMYEGSALAPLAEPLIRQVPFGTEEHVEAKRLLTFLDWFLPIDTRLIPDNSIMREFIGGSILEEFNPWPAP
ncbi:MAG: nucleoside kinase [Anaerolineales bacterium]|nr:MAG: nucleoside kinase [Anaerolineales bacterium]